MRTSPLVSDNDRILAARLIARELLAAHMAQVDRIDELLGSPARGWVHYSDGKGGVVSKSPQARSGARRPR
jgi:hypothetical protein